MKPPDEAARSMTVWAITSGALVVILGWMGLSFIVQEHLSCHQSGWQEMVPRLVLGLTAASSLWWCALVIDVADAVSGFIAASLHVSPGDLLCAPLFALLAAVQTASTGLAVFLALLYLVFGFFVLYLPVQMILRLALIDILLALAPIVLGLWILPHTAGWGCHWLRLFMTTVFQQTVQLIALVLGFGFLGEFAPITEGEPSQDLVWKLLMAVAFMYLAGWVSYFSYGAYLYLTAASAPNQMERGKAAMMTALAGIVLALVAYGVVELVMNAVVGNRVDPTVPDLTTSIGPDSASASV